MNVKVESLRLGIFREDEIRALYGQHTEETGQALSPEALDRLVVVSGGQPWLTNALGREITSKLEVPADQRIELHHVEEARDRLVLARQTHLDSLAAKLHDPRVRPFMVALLAGELAPDYLGYDDDFSYVSDLGLVAPDPPLRIANPIYREVIVRVLSGAAEGSVTTPQRTFIREDGSLDIARVLAEFSAFWREHSEALLEGHAYHEVAPQLVLMAYLQRVVNGGGTIDREYGVGRGRIDLLVRWPIVEPDGTRQLQREAIEIKVWRDGKTDPLDRGLEQLDAYLERLGLDEGVLVIFDRRSAALPVPERLHKEDARTRNGRPVAVLRA